MHEFGREERVGAEIRRELAMLLRDEVRDPRLGIQNHGYTPDRDQQTELIPQT